MFPESSSSAFPHNIILTNCHAHTHTCTDVQIFYMCRIIKSSGAKGFRNRQQATQREVEFGVRKGIMEEKWPGLFHYLTKCLSLFWGLTHKDSHEEDELKNWRRLCCVHLPMEFLWPFRNPFCGYTGRSSGPIAK